MLIEVIDKLAEHYLSNEVYPTMLLLDKLPRPIQIFYVMMNRRVLVTGKKIITHILLLLMVFALVIPVGTTNAASADDVLGSLMSSTTASERSSGGGGVLGKLFNLVFDKILGPVLNIFGNKDTSTNAPAPSIPLPPVSGSKDTVQHNGSLKGKVIVVDPGHGGTNPGAVANNTREADNNLAVGLKLRDKLVQAGAKVVMTRDSDRTVAAKGSSLGQELQARVDIAERNDADIFVSIHTNSNPNSNITGAMTFYRSGESSQLASKVQSALINQTGAVNKGTEAATFYVLRNTSMPSILVEMGFISNANEAARLSDNSYRNNVAQGIYNGIVEYFINR